MANDGKITITITDDRGNGGVRSGKTGAGANSRLANFNNVTDLDKSRDSKFDDFIMHETIHFLKAESMKIVNNYVSTIGVRTGNYVAQQNAQIAMGVCGQGLGIAMAAKSGFKLSGGNPFGALIGAGIGVGLAATNRVIEYQNSERQIRMQNRDIALLRQRAGYDLNNGSR